MALTPGTRLGSYDIIGPLGSGGMGDVYRARDPKLNREVAIKTLPDAFATDPQRAGRFEREAQILAALNHPHIAQVYGVTENPPALIMELVPGESLAQKLAGGAVPLRESLGIARQIALALEAAHERGIVHRDLKPGNVMLTRDGQVKVLDFGLARIAESEANANPSHSPTLTFAPTQMGVILGTAAYMSPEQAKGRVADKRSDVWAFGCLVYELLTGTRAFAGEDISDTLAAVLRGEPDWTQLPAGTPPRLVQLLRRCLEKDRGQRIPDLSVARYEIEHALAGDSGITAVTPAPPIRRSRAGLIAVGAAGALALAAAVFVIMAWPEAQPPRVIRFDVRPPAGVRITNRSTTSSVDIAISRDGGQIAYRVVAEDGSDAIAVRRLDQAQSAIVPGTASGASPSFSPDGQALAFYADQKVKVLLLGTSTPIVASDASGTSGLDWIDNDNIVFTYQGGLSRVARVGGASQVVTQPEEGPGIETHRYPEVTPDGRVLLFVRERGGQRAIVARSLVSGEQKVVVENATFPKYIASGHLVFMLGGRTVGAPFDTGSMQMTGAPVPVDEEVVERPTGSANYDVSPDGTFVSMTGSSMPYVSRFTWYARDGSIVGHIGNEDLPYPRYPRISPDGRRFAGTVGPGIRGHLWVFDLAGSAQPVKLTSVEHNVWPTWTADGKTLIFSRLMTGSTATSERSRQMLMTIPADGSVVEPTLLLPVDIPGRALATVSPDGQWMLLSVTQRGTGADLLLKSLKEPAAPRPWVADAVEEADPAFSPDGKWVAYTSDQTGRTEIWVRPFPGPGAPLRVSPDGGREPVWARNGKELFYQLNDKLMSAAVTSPPSASTISFAAAVAVFTAPFVRSDAATPRTYDVAPDGRFLMIEHKPNPIPSTLNVVVGWSELLKAKIR